jgi:hypothetical protein
MYRIVDNCLTRYFNEDEHLEVLYPMLNHTYFGFEDCVKIDSRLFTYHSFDQLDTDFPMGFCDDHLWMKWYFVPKRLIVEAFQKTFKKTTYRAIYLKMKNEPVYHEFRTYTSDFFGTGSDPVPKYYQKYDTIDPVLRVKFE